MATTGSGIRGYVLRIKKRRKMKDADEEELWRKTEQAIALLAGVEIEYAGPTPPVEDVRFVVTHNLGYLPERVAMVDNGDYGGIVYATPEDKLLWTDKSVVLRCTVGKETNLTFRLTRRPTT